MTSGRTAADLSFMPIRSSPPPLRSRARIAGLTRLLRPGNLLILAGVVFLGWVLGDGPSAFGGPSIGSLLLAIFSAVSIAAAGNAINDLFDIQIDAINKPDRPLVAGRVQVREGWIVWGGCSVLGMLLALAVSPVHLLIAAGCVAMLYVYSARLKRTPIIGNVVIAILAGTAVVYGALLGLLSPPVWAGVGFAFVTTLARELIKDVDDVPGDRQAGLRTAPLVWGARPTSVGAAALLLATVLASPAPFLYLGYGGIYLLAVLVTDAILLRAIWVLLERGDGFAARASGLVKWGMVAGILSLALF